MLKLIFITVSLSLAWKVAISEEMIFERIGYWAEQKVDQGYKVFDLIVCPWCCNTLWVWPAHVAAMYLGLIPEHFDGHFLVRLFIVLCACCFISGVLWTVYLTINQVREKNEAESEYFTSINQGTENLRSRK